MNNRDLTLILALFTLVGFSGIGFVIHYYWADLPPRHMFLDMKMHWGIQIPVGAAIGSIAAYVGWKIISADFMKPIRSKYGGLIGSLNLNMSDIILVSFCAGVGEEILFRGAIQPHWGVWITSFVFVALHGYLNPTNWRISLYGLYMTGVIIALGFMKVEWGIVSAMSAHMFIDIVLLYYLSKDENPRFQQVEGEFSFADEENADDEESNIEDEDDNYFV